MIVEMQEAEKSSALRHSGWSAGLVGPAVDDRGEASRAFVEAQADVVIDVGYDHESLLVSIGGDSIDPTAVSDALALLAVDGRLIADATTIGFPELLYACHALVERFDIFSALDVLYTEPGQYSRQTRSRPTPPYGRDFVLSSEVPGYQAVPGIGRVPLFRDGQAHTAVFFLGFEPDRFERAFEDHPMLLADRCAVVFGLPAYRVGMEMDAFANCVGAIKRRNLRDVYYCPADNPRDVVRQLRLVEEGLGPGEPMFLAPIGTKPHAVGVAAFAAERGSAAGVGLLYDHPRRSEKRSVGVGTWHLYRLTRSDGEK